MWLVGYYCSVVDVLSPACGLAVAVSAVVLLTMYGDIANSVTVRVSGMLGLTDAAHQICQLMVRELAMRPAHQNHDSAAARLSAFAPYFLRLLNVLVVNRVALDLEINFLGWFPCSRMLRWVLRHYVSAAAALALALSLPLLATPAHFDGAFLYAQWTFGSTARDIAYIALTFYVWVLLLLLNFAAVVVGVVVRLRTQLPSAANPTSSLSTRVMLSLEHHMRRKARILLLYPLSPILFYGPSLVFFWVQTLHLRQTRATRAIWITASVVGPLQALYDFAVFALLPPVHRVVAWHWTLHKDADNIPLIVTARRDSTFAALSPRAGLSVEEVWVQDVATPYSPPLRLSDA
ncbi:hypothetical protein IWQ57_002306 [Coemansia nantahalensis]|uniref:Uncharacterized protein n=1 Tax=Coemansia nantahalensis TaxID=2789366 RepID=A0ACC1K1E8_9FUNG|nr:hypothetical protein IWQ57_002306 [Coemansia nantahalensis]